jgi:hypothetical protein
MLLPAQKYLNMVAPGEDKLESLVLPAAPLFPKDFGRHGAELRPAKVFN